MYDAAVTTYSITATAPEKIVARRGTGVRIACRASRTPAGRTSRSRSRHHNRQPQAERLLDSYPALVLPWAVSAFAIFLFRRCSGAFPTRSSTLPGSTASAYSPSPSASPCPRTGRPYAFSIFSVVAHWNDLYWPMVVVTSTERMTPPLGIAYFREGGGVDGNVGALMAGGVILTTPSSSPSSSPSAASSGLAFPSIR